MLPSVQDRSPRRYGEGAYPPPTYPPYGQVRSARLDPITIQPRALRIKAPPRPDSWSGDALGASMRSFSHDGVPRGFPSSGGAPRGGDPSISPSAPSQSPSPQPKKSSNAPGGLKNSPFAPTGVLAGLSHAAAAMRELDWTRLFHALDVIFRFYVPCEALTLYIVEERGRYIRKVNAHLDCFPPELRGHAVDPVSDTTLEGSTSITAEACGLPSQSKYATDWATHETTSTTPLPGLPSLDDLNAGRIINWPPEGWEDSDKGGPVVQRVHNVLAWPLRFGTTRSDPEDPYLDYSSTDSNQVGADETIFGVLKLTNRLAERPKKGMKSQIERLAKQRGRGKDIDTRYRPFSESDLNFAGALTRLLRELYFAVDPVTFGSRIERSLDLNKEDAEPLNAPSVTGKSMMSGSRMIEQGQGTQGGMFGILGSAFAKSSSQRRRAAEIPDIVQQPCLTVTSDSTESMRNAPGWIHKEWTEDDLDTMTTDAKSVGQRRLGGITLLATWRLREDAVVDPYCVICRFQLRVRRTSHARPGQELWRVLPPFFCISPDAVTQQYCAFLTEYIQYGEEYIVCARAGSADRWSEWSAPSEIVRFVAEPLKPKEPRQPLGCVVVPNAVPEGPVDPFGTRDHMLRFSWQAFTSFDPRTPLPVEYRIEAWQRVDSIGAAAAEQIESVRGSQARSATSTSGFYRQPPGSTADWTSSRLLAICTTTSDATEGKFVECTADVRLTGLVPCSEVYFSVCGRYLSLPGAADWCEDALYTQGPVLIPCIVPELPAPLPHCAADFPPLSSHCPQPAACSAVSSWGSLVETPSLVVQWPFMHPETFCPPSVHNDGWSPGPYAADRLPTDFPLPYRMQYRTIHAGIDTHVQVSSEAEPPDWSEWREVQGYEFVKRIVRAKQPSQVDAGQKASRGDFMPGHPEILDAKPLVLSSQDGDPAAQGFEDVDGECLDMHKDPLGLLTEDWGLRIVGLVDGVSEEHIEAWPGLVQLRWISCRVEGNASSASRVFCTKVSAPCSAPDVEHIVTNFSSGKVRGQAVLDSGFPDAKEDVVYELKQMVRLSWQMDISEPSFSFIKSFKIRYQEVAPNELARDSPWLELKRVPIASAHDVTTAAQSNATFAVDIDSVVLLRYYRYVFSVQVHTDEHVSPWSIASFPLKVLLPDVVAPTVGLEQSAGDGPGVLDAHVHCSNHQDASLWHIELRWAAFPLSDDGATRFPALEQLPVEFQISYHVLSDRPCAVDASGAEDTALRSREEQVQYSGIFCAEVDETFRQQREGSVVCCEGVVSPQEKTVTRKVLRHRLPAFRCDVRLFVVCRCPALTGPNWSKSALMVDVALPRQAPLPVPVPRQLGCIELQSYGLPMDFGEPASDGGTRDDVLAPGSLWAVLRIPSFPTEFVVTGSDAASAALTADQNLLALAGTYEDLRQASSVPHYVLQYRRHNPEIRQCGSGACPLLEEPQWHTARSVRLLQNSGEESVYLVSDFDAFSTSYDAPLSDGMHWVTLRLASNRLSHFSYASPPVCLSTLPPPSKPSLRLDWVDSPGLDGLRVRASAKCHTSSHVYQLRYRSSETAPEGGWRVCEVQELEPCSLGKEGEDFWIEARPPIHELLYHGEYVFSLRTASPVRYSAWSEESSPVRLSLEHFGMRPMGTLGLEGLQVRLLGLEERHNYRCPAADIVWPPLSFPPDVWEADSVSPSPELTIEYRVRWRRRIALHNDRAALRAVVEELGAEHRAKGSSSAGRSAVLEPDPDFDSHDVADRGYKGDITKWTDMKHEFSPWRTAAVVPAKASGTGATSKCACMLSFLQPGTEYDVAIDWRWRRLGDPFWMPAYEPLRFSTSLPTPVPAPPKPLPLPLEVWDQTSELHNLRAERFAFLHWPFAHPPTSAVTPAPVGRLLAEAARLDPLANGDYAVQCRLPQRASPGAAAAESRWTTCEASYHLINGKPVCLISRLPLASDVVGAPTTPFFGAAEGLPCPIPTPALEPGAMGDDELEFRIVRIGDCDTSVGIPCIVTPPPAPQEVSSKLKMLPPHSTLVLSVRFSGVVAAGCSSAPCEYQVRIEDMDGETRLLAPAKLPLERVPEAFERLRDESDFLGEAYAPDERSELGDCVLLSRGGGENAQLLPLLDFEHVLSLRELTFGHRYLISVRFLSKWRVSEWAVPTEAKIEIAAPKSANSADLNVSALDPLELPTDHAGKDFMPPALAHRAMLSWLPFQAFIWGGGKMEYHVQRRCMLGDQRPGDDRTLDTDAPGVELTAWELVGNVLTNVEDSTGEGMLVPQGGELRDIDGSPRLTFSAEELMPSACYQFRLFARLLFHPVSGYSGEWSEPITSAWYRTENVVPEPKPPFEAAVPDPPPPELLGEGNVLVEFGELPLREDDRPAGCPLVPAPYILHVRGAEQPSTAPWFPIDCTELAGSSNKFLVASELLKNYLARGVVFRLWRCRVPHVDSPHTANDDIRVRHFGGLYSQPSLPMSVRCPRFIDNPRVELLFAAQNDEGMDEDSGLEDAPIQRRPTSPENSRAVHVPVPPLVVSLEWTVDVPVGDDLAPVTQHQVRYMLLPSDEDEGENDDWHQLLPFEHTVTREEPVIIHQLPAAAPRFLLGGDYMISVRIGTHLRWGDWSPPLEFSLSIRPPKPPADAEVKVVPITLKDGTIFFKLSWPSFRPHPLCTLVEYRIRMMRVTRYKYSTRLSPEMAERSKESLAAQQKYHVIGTVRRQLPARHIPALSRGRKASILESNEERRSEILEFVHDIAADPECGYRFIVDAKHERCSEIRSNGGEEWSAEVVSTEVVTPPRDQNWFVPQQVPLEVSPSIAGRDRERVRAPFPLALGELTCERLHLNDAYAPFLLIFAPWRTAPGIQDWPHRIEYTPYIPCSNPTRHPAAGDEDELKVEWHLPQSVEYFQEDADPTAEVSEPTVAFALIQGVDEELWEKQQARFGTHMGSLGGLDLFARVRVVREAGPEGLQYFSSPSAPMRLRMPTIDGQPSVTVWCVAGKPHAVIWWPAMSAMSAEEDKNLDLSTQVHQIRMRRPLYELDAGWIEAPVTRSQVPVLLMTSSGQAALHLFDCCPLLNDSTMPQEQLSLPLPAQATGVIPEPAILTYEFAVRVSDGFRWSEWSKPTAPCNFALTPSIVEDAPVSLADLAKNLRPTEATVASAEMVDQDADQLCQQVSYHDDGEMEPPTWVSVDVAQQRVNLSSSRPFTPSPRKNAERDAKVSQFIARWPNLPPHAYCQPDPTQLAVLEELLSTRLLPQYVPPPIIYRVNVWLVSSAADAAPMHGPEELQSQKAQAGERHGDEHHGDEMAGSSEQEARNQSSEAEVDHLYEFDHLHEIDEEDGMLPQGEDATLYRQFDIPPCAFPEPDAFDIDLDGQCQIDSLTQNVPYLLPDRVFRISVEAKFQTLTAVEWWTPLMRSATFTVPRVPPPAPPEIMPVCNMPTPEYEKLTARLQTNSSTLLVVRWPWGCEGKAIDMLHNSVYGLEFCPCTERPSLRDPTSKILQMESESVVCRRQLGPWYEAKAMQIVFAHFPSGQVVQELPPEAQVEPNWIPILVASGFMANSTISVTNAEVPTDLVEAPFVQVRWMYRANPQDLALIPTPLHFSAASSPIRTRVVEPLKAPEWHLDCPPRSSRMVAWIRWVAWAGANTHQLSLRVLQKPRKHKSKKRRRRRRMSGSSTDFNSQASQTSGADSDAGSSSASAGTGKSGKRGRSASCSADFALPEGNPEYEPVTGWIELPPLRDHLETAQPRGDVVAEVSAAGFPVTDPLSEEFLLSEFTYRLPPREWNQLLFRYYRDRDEHYDPGRSDVWSGSRVTTAESSASRSHPTEDVTIRSAKGTARLPRSLAESNSSSSIGKTGSGQLSGSGGFQKPVNITVTDSSKQSLGLDKGGGSMSDLEMKSDGGLSTSSHRSRRRAGVLEGRQSFRMRWGMVVEWRVRVSDGFLWSGWSSPSPHMGLMPPIPMFSTPMHIDFSRWEPTIARLAWGICDLPAGYEHLAPTIEYVVYLSSDTSTARSVLQAGRGTFSVEQLHTKGIALSDGNCGVVSNYVEEGEDVEVGQDGVPIVKPHKFNLEDLFTDGSEQRIVGKFRTSDAKWINFKGADENKPVTGFELTVSGLKPETVHRFTVRARCATAGLDEPDWQKMKIDPVHPLRWSDPLHTSPVLTPRMPPPLLVPEPVPIPDGRFGRFLHTPCVLLKCALFKKAHPDDFDKAHPFVLDVRAQGEPDEDYREVPLENSVYCEVEPYGPCRLIYNMPHLHAELRTRNLIMNDISAACPPAFTVPPLPLEKQGPAAELIVTEDGNFFVQLTWTTRCLPMQELQHVQLSLKRHSVEAPPMDLQAISVTPSMVLEEIPSNAVTVAGEAFSRLRAEAEDTSYAAWVAAQPVRGDHYCPFLCRRCCHPLDVNTPVADLGPLARSRLGDARRMLEDGTVRAGQVPEYRGWGDDLRELRVPHRAEVERREHATADEATRREVQAKARAKGGAQVCRCKDFVLRKTVAVDGDKVCYGTTYRFRLRVRDSLKWSSWTEFSAPVFVSVPPPKPIMPQKDPQSPVPPPSIEVQLAKSTTRSKPESAGLPAGGEADVHLRLSWHRFEGSMTEVDYRVFMWTLSPEQRQRASRRQFEIKNRSGLPPISGTQTIALNPDSSPSAQTMASDITSPVPLSPSKVSTANRAGTALRPDNGAPTLLAKPRAIATVMDNAGQGVTTSSKGAAVQHGADAPQLVAHLRPFETAPRANATRRAPKTVAAAAKGNGTSEPVAAGTLGEAEPRNPSVEISAAVLPKGYGYVFGVEAKHGRGACGSIGEWSTPIFSKFIDFECAPRHLTLEIDARFGSLLFKGSTSTKANPVNEQVAVQASAVSFVDEHRDLPRAMGLAPDADPWPLPAAPGGGGKYVMRTKGRSVFAERLGLEGDLTTDHLPETSPHGDEHREN